MKKTFSTKFMVRIALLSVISLLLYFISVPVPTLFPDFLKFDLSDVPSLIGGIAFGPFAAFFIQLFKNLLNAFLATTTGGIGELANFLMGTSLVVPFAFIFRKIRGTKGFVIAGIISVIIMSIVGGLLNAYVLLPMYANLYGVTLDYYVELGTALNSSIVDLKTFILFSIVPFNIVKGTIVVVSSGILYKYLKPHIMRMEALDEEESN